MTYSRSSHEKGPGIHAGVCPDLVDLGCEVLQREHGAVLCCAKGWSSLRWGGEVLQNPEHCTPKNTISSSIRSSISRCDAASMTAGQPPSGLQLVTYPYFLCAPLSSLDSSFLPPETWFHSDYGSYVTSIIEILRKGQKNLKKSKWTLWLSAKESYCCLNTYVYTCIPVYHLLHFKCLKSDRVEVYLFVLEIIFK